MLASKQIPSSRVRDTLGELMEQTYYQGKVFIIERSKKPMVALISIDQYQQWLRQRQEDFQIFTRVWQKNRGFSHQEIKTDVTKAIKAVKKAK